MSSPQSLLFLGPSPPNQSEGFERSKETILSCLELIKLFNVGRSWTGDGSALTCRGFVESPRACASHPPYLTTFLPLPTSIFRTLLSTCPTCPKMITRAVPQLVVSALAGLAAAQILSPATPWPIRKEAASLDTWLAAESTYALDGVLNNVGAQGGKAQGASSGIVVASPSKNDPNCKCPRG